MKPVLVRLFGAVVLLVGLVYAGDYLSARFRSPNRQEVFDSVAVTPLYVIHQKNGKVEYQFAPPQNEVCVRSLLPHFGYSPCWYVRRHTEKRIEI